MSDRLMKDGKPLCDEDDALSAAHYRLWRRGQIDDPTLDKIHEKTAQAFNEQEREAALRKLQRLGQEADNAE